MFIEAPDAKKKRTHYTELVKLINDPVFLKNLYNYFKSRDISEFNPKNIIVTDFKKNLIAEGAPAYLRFVPATIKDLIKYKEDECEDGDNSIKAITLYDMAIKYARDNRLESTFTKAKFYKEFKTVYGAFNQLNHKGQSIYIFPADATRESMLEEIRLNYVEKGKK